MSVCYYLLHLLPDYDFIYIQWPNQRERANFDPLNSVTAWSIWWNSNLGIMSWRPPTTQNFISIPRCMGVVSANTQLTTVTEKTISVVHFSPGSAKILVRRNGITHHHSIAYSISNSSAKNYQNRLMCVEVIVCNISVVFRRNAYCVSKNVPP